MQDNMAAPFGELVDILAKNPALVKIVPPKPNTKSPITTGSLVWPNGQLVISGPPCSILNPIQEDGTVAFSKISLRLNPADGSVSSYATEEQDKIHHQERSYFTTMLRDLDKTVEERITKETATYFPSHPDLSSDKIFVSPSLSEPSDPKYPYNLSCKVDLIGTGPKEHFPYETIKLDVRDVVEDNEGGFVYKTIPEGLKAISRYDVVVPTFRGAYVYFQACKNPRSKDVDQYTCKVQWILSGLFRIRQVKDLKRKSRDNDEGAAWVGALSLRKYMTTTTENVTTDEGNIEE